MDKTLFLGNGLNRTLDSGISWSDLMMKLDPTGPKTSDIPFPIEFERIAASKGCMIGKRNADQRKELLDNLAGLINEMGEVPGAAHHAFRNLPFNHFVTTNYDQIFENLYGKLEEEIDNPGPYRNILDPIYRAGSVDFYHAHGIARWKNTLCLGHNHYASLMGKIRPFFYDDDDNLILRDLVTGKRSSSTIWPEYLFTNEVAIVGLGLDYCEIDLWWLLALRAALFAPCEDLKGYENLIIYYMADIEGEELSAYDIHKIEALESFGVSVERVPAETYESAYIEIASRIKKSWS